MLKQETVTLKCNNISQYYFLLYLKKKKGLVSLEYFFEKTL